MLSNVQSINILRFINGNLFDVHYFDVNYRILYVLKLQIIYNK